MLTQFAARAFKGLRSFNISPQRMNLLIGANGTGKTNFADGWRRDVSAIRVTG